MSLYIKSSGDTAAFLHASNDLGLLGAIVGWSGKLLIDDMAWGIVRAPTLENSIQTLKKAKIWPGNPYLSIFHFLTHGF